MKKWMLWCVCDIWIMVSWSIKLTSMSNLSKKTLSLSICMSPKVGNLISYSKGQILKKIRRIQSTKRRKLLLSICWKLWEHENNCDLHHNMWLLNIENIWKHKWKSHYPWYIKIKFWSHWIKYKNKC
jgi:hypothetical protein